MKKQIPDNLLKMSLILLCFLFSIRHTLAQETKSLWTEADRQYTLDNMKRTRDALVKETENLTPAQWAFRDSAHRWSIGQVVEHLALWEIIWAREIGMGCRSKPQPELNATSRPDSYYSSFIMEDIPHTAPDFAVPTGYITGKDNLMFFLRGRGQAIKFVETTKYDMRAQFELVNTPNPRNMHQVLIYQWGHVDRHLKQIQKLKSHKDYPTSNDKISDETAIKAAIIAQSTAWANRDSLGYINSFADETVTQTMHNYADGTYSIAKGKNAIQEKLRANLKASPYKTYEPNIERKDWLIKILSPEWAWVNFIQRTTNVKGEIYTSYDTRLMKKVGGNWKLSALNALWDYKNVEKKVENTSENDYTTDKKAIMATIQKETDCFYERNYDCWKDTYVHEKYVFQGWSNRDGTFDTKVSWDTVNFSIKKYIQNTPKSPHAQKPVERRNLQYKFYTDTLAYMTWDQYQVIRDGTKYQYSKEIRLMEKHNGQWKIACVAAFWDYKNYTLIADLKP
jgi:hypothetical protein